MGRVLAPTQAIWEGNVTIERAALDVPDGSVHLFTYPLLVDEGRLVERADELKLALGEPAFLEVHPDDAASSGITDGGRAIVRTDAGQAELPVRVTDRIASRTAFVPFNNPGLQANTLLSGSFDTIATLEAVAPADASPDATAGDGSGSEQQEVPA
jgi:predicted molibdopterin-dependent oxidoreductase YjgC